MSQEGQFGIADIWNQDHNLEPGERHLASRRVSQALAGIMDQLVRMEAEPEQMNELAEQLESIDARLSEFAQRDPEQLMLLFVNNQGSSEDILDIIDFDLLVGQSAPITVPMEIWREPGCIQGKANVGRRFMGPPGRIHGGVISCMFDVLLAHTQMLVDSIGFTGTLNIKYFKATPIEADITMKAWIDRVEGRKLYNVGEIYVNGEVTARAEGIWIAALDQLFPVEKAG